MSKNNTENFLNRKVRFGPSLDKIKMKQFVDANITNFDKNVESSQFNDDSYFYDTKEAVFSAYMMGKLKFDNYLLLGGIRVEKTNALYKAQVTEYGKAPTLRKEQDNYLYLLPNLQLKINFSEKSVVRLAYTTGFVRPNYIEVVPSVYAESDNTIIHLGNPSLKPSYTNSLDLLFEKYFINPGLFSLGFFYKSISDFHYQVMLPFDELLLPENLAGRFNNQWSIIKMLNGEKASVWGVETNYQSNFNFLPGEWKNAGVYFNYTYVFSKAKTNIGTAIKLPGQSPHTMNVALTYKKNRIESRVSLNYNGEFIYRAGFDSDSDVYQDQRWQLDLNTTYRLNKHTTVFAEFINITNSKQLLFWGDRSRIYQLDSFGWWSRLGISFRF
jgi:TonB-dependent receptor